MIELKEYQKKAVNELMEKTVELLNTGKARNKLFFKAPTGAGKTVMASVLLDRLTYELPTRGDCLYLNAAFIWIAPNKLHEQSYLSMKNYFTETRNLKPVMYDELDFSAGYLKPGEILFVNWESINKDNAVMIRDNEQCRSLYLLTRKTQIEKEIPIIVVIDEEHMFGGRNAKKSEMVLQNINPKLEIRISATPNVTSDYIVPIPRSKVVDEEMIKEGILLNPAVTGSDSDLTVNQRLLKQSLDKRNELAECYKKLGLTINPLLLIQLPNDTKDSMTSEDKTVAEEVTQYLDAYHSINVDNGKLAVWLSGEKKNVDGLTASTCLTEVLLFKQAIALGWDCPRAAVLLIFRELQSVTFSTQTVGRILRMPEQRFYSDPALNKGYVFTNLSQDIIQVVADDMDYISTIYARRKENFRNEELLSFYMNKRLERNRLGKDFKNVLKQVFKEYWELYELSLFDDAAFGIEPSPEELIQRESTIIKNRQKAIKHFVTLDVKRVFVAIPKDLPMLGEQGQVEVTQKARMARTQGELNRLFDLYCRKNVGPFAKFDSMPVLRGALIAMMEDFFEIFETDAIKIILYHSNQTEFTGKIGYAITRYQKLLNEKKKQAIAFYQSYTWTIPELRIFSSDAYNEVEAYLHAMRPFFESKTVSRPEYIFSRYLEKNTESIDWWYKNGDSGKMNFAVPYKNMQGDDVLFYVDYIIRLKSGKICLFDTKTKGSDPNAALKHNALLAYMREQNARGRKLMGGIIIQDSNSEKWFYSPLEIEHTDSLEGWSEFDPRIID